VLRSVHTVTKKVVGLCAFFVRRFIYTAGGEPATVEVLASSRLRGYNSLRININMLCHICPCPIFCPTIFFLQHYILSILYFLPDFIMVVLYFERLYFGQHISPSMICPAPVRYSLLLNIIRQS
jgi:hypothetical protein